MFAAYLTYEYLDEVYEEQVDTPYNDVVFGLVTFGVTLFFFLAIVRQRRRKISVGRLTNKSIIRKVIAGDHIE